MLTLAFVLAITAAALLGYHYRQLYNAIEALKMAQEERKQPSKIVDKATLLDPDDVIARAKWEHEQQLKELNHD